MARRSFLFLLFVLCFGLAVPALALQGGRGANNDGVGSGQGGGPPTTSATATTAATTTTAVTTTSNGNGNGNGQGGGPPTTAATTTGNGNGQGGGPPTTTATTTGNGNGQGGGPLTTATTTGNGQGSGPPVTDTTANGTGIGQGNGNNSGQSTTTPPLTATTARQAPIAEPVATNDDTGRVATFLAASQIPVETDTGSAPPPTSEGQSAPERMISWLLTGNEQRFLPIVASPFVALMVVGRALTSAGSGAIAPVVLLGAVGFTKLLDGRRAKRLVPIAFLP